MIWALINDLAQRVVSGNKWEQRRSLRRRLKALALPPGSKALDFGCGTGLFASTFAGCGLAYHGYDIDGRMVSYARLMHPRQVFASERNEIARHGPFDLVVANCCFHHIPDDVLAEELEWIKSILADRGTFLLIDLIVADPADRSVLRRAFRAPERGDFQRRGEEYVAIVAAHLAVRRVGADRTHIFSIPGPVYADLVVVEAAK
jgi:SAM-dependent methyltransferase